MYHNTLCRMILFAALMGVMPNAFAQNDPPAWDVYSDTWDATDVLGRALPTFEETGPPRADKQIGVFYFLWNGRHGDEGPYDVNKILAQDPDAMQKKDSPLWGRMYVPHHWGESIFHYYVGEDEGVLRKHAQMLGDAGVDVVIFDVTNQLTYPESYRALCNVFREVRAAGNHAPQIAFLTPFWSPKKVVNELYRDFYSKGDYEDLWYRWNGKPLIMADPDLLGEMVEMKRTNTPIPLAEDTSTNTRRLLSERGNAAITQYFIPTKPFRAISICVPTWNTKDSSVQLSLLEWYDEEGAPTYKVIKSQTFTNIADNGWLVLELDSPAPPKPPSDFLSYCLVLHSAKGRVGWWSGEKHPDIDLDGTPFSSAKPSRPLSMRLYVEDGETPKIRDFFTFRKPQPDYFVGPTGANQWGWLEVFPQHGFYVLDENGKHIIEQATVGTAQNAVDGKLGVLSNPRSHGRSFHDGKEPPPEEQDFTGKNFAEQWRRAFELDPKFVFITGWNEWIMGRFDETAHFNGVGVVSFVDQFNTEFSRDIEPMIGGHEDAYYYQFIAYNRLFKGTRPLSKVVPQAITVDGLFDDWADVSPEFRDTIGDPVHRDERGWGKDTRYANTTGRNDLVVAKVSYDAENVYFYVRTKDEIVGVGEPNWMMLYIDTDGEHDTGWLGYDLAVNRGQQTANANAQVKQASVERNVDDKYEWSNVANIECRVRGRELELAIPFKLLNDKSQLSDFIRFKWADNIQQTGEWSDLTINGDVAPNDRYNYRAVLK